MTVAPAILAPRSRLSSTANDGIISPPMSDARTPGRPEEDEEAVPVFGTWPRIYAAVIVSAILVMALVGAFSRWPW